MVGEPRASDWVIPGVLAVLLYSLANLLPALPLNPLSMEFGALVACSGGLIALCVFVTGAQFIRWSISVRNTELQRQQEAKAVTPLLRAAQAVRTLTPEQSALVSLYMPGENKVVYVEQEDQLIAHFMLPDGAMVTWEEIEDFLHRSNAVYLHNINDTSAGTRDRLITQALTDFCVRVKGWATPHAGNQAAMWRPGCRDKAAKYWHIKLRNGTGYIEPEEPENETDE